jgi:hypothetical protein
MLEIWFGGIKSKLSNIMEFCKIPNVYLDKARVTILPTISQHSVLENRPLFQKLHYVSLSETQFHRSSEKKIPSQWNDTGVVPLFENRCPISNAMDSFCIRHLVTVLLRVATRLLKPLRDMLAIWYGVIKTKIVNTT